MVGQLGLTETEAARRLAKYGENRFVRIQQIGPLEVLDLLFSNFYLPAIALVLAIVLLILADAIDPLLALAALALVFLTALSETSTDVYRASVVRELQLKHHGHAIVVRDGLMKEIDAWAIVPGDVVLLRPGDRVPGDGRIVEGRVKCDERALGRGVVERRSVSEAELRLIEFEKKPDPSQIFAGTFVLEGSATARIERTGLATAYAKVQLPYVHERELARAASRAMSLISWVVAAIAAAIFALAVLNVGVGLVTALLLATAAAYVGFPALWLSLVNTCYFRAAERARVVVRRERVLDGLRGCDIVVVEPKCILTQGRLTIGRIWADGTFVDVTGEGWAAGEIRGGDPKTIEELATAAALVSDAVIVHFDETLRVHGDPLEAALVVLAAKARIPIESTRAQWPCAARKTKGEIREVVRVRARERAQILFGPAQSVLERCDALRLRGETVKLKSHAREIERAVVELAAGGYDVYALAKGEGKRKALLALLGVYDPIKDGAREALEQLQRRGLRVVLIDEGSETSAIRTARELGILGPRKGKALLCHLLEDMSPRQRAEAIRATSVFARVEPKWLKIIIEELSKTHNITLIKTAGLDTSAMELAKAALSAESSPDILKFSSDAIIEDDNLSNFVRAIDAAREIVDRAERALCALFAFDFAVLLFLLLSAALALQLPSFLYILVLNFIGDTAAVSLVIAPAQQQRQQWQRGQQGQRGQQQFQQSQWQSQQMLKEQLDKKEFPSTENIAFALFIALYSAAIAAVLNLASLGAAIAALSAILIAVLFSYSTKELIIREAPPKEVLAMAAIVAVLVLALIYVPSELALPLPPVMWGPIAAAALGALILSELREVLVGQVVR